MMYVLGKKAKFLGVKSSSSEVRGISYWSFPFIGEIITMDEYPLHTPEESKHDFVFVRAASLADDIRGGCTWVRLDELSEIGIKRNLPGWF